MKNLQRSIQELSSQDNSSSLGQSTFPQVQNSYEFVFLPQNTNLSNPDQNSCSTIPSTQNYSLQKPPNEDQNIIITDSQSNSLSSQTTQNPSSPITYNHQSSNFQPPYISPLIINQSPQKSKQFQPLQIDIKITDKLNFNNPNQQPLLSPVKPAITSNQYQPSYCTMPTTSTMIIQQNPTINNKLNSFNFRIRWTKEEDEQLLNLVRRWGARRWNEIAASLGTKTAKQCRDHYANCLDPGIRNSLWTVEEEEILLSKYNEIGPHWSRIRTFFPGRTNAMIKNYTIMLLKKNGKEMPPEIQIQKDNEESSCSSGNEDNDDDQNEQKKISEKQKNQKFSANDLNFLLNRPTKFPDSS